MKKTRLVAIEYIRGISMMGVIGIHVGSQYWENPSANIHLMALFEAVTRFSVPIFFFISAFGLFYNLNLNAPFDYISFMKRRFRTVLIPYLVWSMLYFIPDSFIYHTGIPQVSQFLHMLFFGLAKYHLYFLVIMLWFYMLMPLWIWMVRHGNWKNMSALLIFQVAFDYFSSFNVPFNVYIYDLPDDSLLKPLLMLRLNYWVLHYIFIFILGGILATHIDKFKDFMQKRKLQITSFFCLSLAGMIGYYYYVIYSSGYASASVAVKQDIVLAAINTAHQLCPAGIFYTIGSSIFFFMIFTYVEYPNWLRQIFSLLGKHSYFVYLAHPFAITLLTYLLHRSEYILTAPLAILFYLGCLGITLGVAVFCRKVGTVFPILNLLTVGVSPAPAKITK